MAGPVVSAVIFPAPVCCLAIAVQAGMAKPVGLVTSGNHQMKRACRTQSWLQVHATDSGASQMLGGIEEAHVCDSQLMPAAKMAEASGEPP